MTFIKQKYLIFIKNIAEEDMSSASNHSNMFFTVSYIKIWKKYLSNIVEFPRTFTILVFDLWIMVQKWQYIPKGQIYPCAQNAVYSMGHSLLCSNISATLITAMGCRQCLSLSVVHLKGTNCLKPHCRSGVEGTFRH